MFALIRYFSKRYGTHFKMWLREKFCRPEFVLLSSKTGRVCTVVYVNDNDTDVRKYRHRAIAAYNVRIGVPDKPEIHYILTQRLVLALGYNASYIVAMGKFSALVGATEISIEQGNVDVWDKHMSLLDMTVSKLPEYNLDIVVMHAVNTILKYPMLAVEDKNYYGAIRDAIQKFWDDGNNPYDGAVSVN